MATPAYGIKPIQSFLTKSYNAAIVELVINNSAVDNIYLNDPVKSLYQSSADGIGNCVKATPGDAIRGIVVGFKVIHERENRLYHEAGTTSVVRVCQDPFLICEAVINAAILSTDINRYINIDNGTGNNITGESRVKLDYATISNDDGQFKILKILEVVNNGIQHYSIVQCICAKHELIHSVAISDTLWNYNSSTNTYSTKIVGANVKVDGKLTVDGIIDPTGLTVSPQTSPPSIENGTHYYDSLTKKFRFREDNAWVSYVTETEDNLWKRIGTILSPKIDGDSLGMAGATIYGNTISGGTLALDSTSHVTKGLITIGNGTTLRSLSLNYETFILHDNDIPNKKYIDDHVAPLYLWDREYVEGIGFKIYQHNGADNLDLSAAKGFLKLPMGTTAEQPIPVNGMSRYNTTINKFDFCENGAWVNYLTETVENLWDRIADVAGFKLRQHVVTDNIDLSSATGYLKFPSGTTPEQPIPVNGMSRYNTTINKFDFCENGAWVNYLTDLEENLWDRIAEGVGFKLYQHTATDNIDLSSATGYLKFPSGVTGQRLTPTNGMSRYNITDNKFEFYENGVWVNYLTETVENLWDRVVADIGGFKLRQRNLSDDLDLSSAVRFIRFPIGTTVQRPLVTSESIDQFWDIVYDVYPFNDCWQSYTAGKTEYVVAIGTNHNISSVGPLTMTIYSGEGTGGTVLSEKTGIYFQVGWNKINIPPFLQTLGQKYTIRLWKEAFSWRIDVGVGTVYPGGTFNGNAGYTGDFRVYTLLSLTTNGMGRYNSDVKRIEFCENNAWVNYLTEEARLWDRSGTILSPHTAGDSINVGAGCIGNTNNVTDYISRFLLLLNEVIDQEDMSQGGEIPTDGDGWQSFTAGNNDYLYAIILKASDLVITPPPQTISILLGEGPAGAVLWSKSNVVLNTGMALTRIDIDTPIKQTINNKYTIRIQGAQCRFVYDPDGYYTRGTYKGTATDITFRTLTRVVIDVFNISKLTGLATIYSGKISSLTTAGGIVQTDATGLLSSSVTLPNGTLATTQAFGDNTTKLATTAFAQFAGKWSRMDRILTPYTFGDSVNIGTGCLGNTDDVIGYCARFQYSASEVIDQIDDNWWGDENSGGDGWQSFTAGNSDYLTAIRLAGGDMSGAELSPPQTISILSGEGNGGTVLWSKPNVRLIEYDYLKINIDVPIKLTLGNKYTIRVQGDAFNFYGDGTGAYIGGSYKGTASDLVFATYTTALIDIFNISNSDGITTIYKGKLSFLTTANGIVQTDATGLLSSSTVLPNGTTATTQTAGDNTTKLATTAFVQESIVTENLWDRVAPNISPHFTDNVNMKSGSIGNVTSYTDYLFKFENGPETVDQSQTTGNTGMYAYGNGWQSYTAGNDNFLTKVRLKVNQVDALTQTVNIYSGEGTSGTLLYTRSFTFTAQAWNDIAITTPMPQVAGQKYTIHIPAVGTFEFKGSTSNSYAGGRYVANPNWDIQFETYTAKLSPIFSAKRDTGYFGFGTLTPTALVDVNGVTKSQSLQLTGVAGATVNEIMTSTLLTGAANTNLATALALKTYIDNKIPFSAAGFSALLSTSQLLVTGDGTVYNIICNTELYDYGNIYDPITGKVTIPSTGIYLFICQVSIYNLTSGHTGGYFELYDQLDIATILSEGNYGAMHRQAAVAPPNLYIINCSYPVYLTAGKIIGIRVCVENSFKTISIVGAAGSAGLFTGFSCFKIA